MKNRPLLLFLATIFFLSSFSYANNYIEKNENMDINLNYESNEFSLLNEEDMVYVSYDCNGDGIHDYGTWISERYAIAMLVQMMESC